MACKFKAEVILTTNIAQCTSLVSLTIALEMCINEDPGLPNSFACCPNILACAPPSTKYIKLELYTGHVEKSSTYFREVMDAANWAGVEGALMNFRNLDTVRITFVNFCYSSIEDSDSEYWHGGKSAHNMTIRAWKKVGHVLCETVNGKLEMLRNTGVKVVFEPSERGFLTTWP